MTAAKKQPAEIGQVWENIRTGTMRVVTKIGDGYASMRLDRPTPRLPDLTRVRLDAAGWPAGYRPATDEWSPR